MHPTLSAAALAAIGAALGLSCATPPRQSTVIPLRSSSVGAVETYGPGLVATDDSGETVTFELAAAASVVLVRVWPGWRLEPLYPTRNRDTTRFAAGTHVVRVPRPLPWNTPSGAREAPLPPAPAAAREPDSLVAAANEYYLVLVASDVALDGKRLRQKLAGIDITGTEIMAVLQTLPGFLASHARTWAGYAARVGGQ